MSDTEQKFELGGLIVPNDPALISPKIARRLSRQNYAKAKLAHLDKVLRPGARLLELGTEIGVVAAISAKTKGVERVAAVEVNPAYKDYITALWAQNGVENATLYIGMPVERAGVKKAEFYLRDPLWDSSLAPEADRPSETVTLENLPLPKLIEEVDPTVILCTLQGLELPLFDAADLNRVDHLIIEVTPAVYGQDALREFVDMLGTKGFMPAPDTEDGKRMICFERVKVPGQVPEGAMMPRRRFRAAAEQTPPRVLVPTCMKNEGPFILEWLAWHRVVGVTDFLIFTNDCTDGTDQLLDRLDDMGLVHHLPNPALGQEATNFQPVMLRYLPYTREFREADYVISMDVDEFINIRAGDGRFADLVEAAGDFDVLSMSEINHGSNDRLRYERGWLTEQFPGHQNPGPGEKKAHRGVKSITKMSPRVTAVRNHRPDLSESFGTVRWLDGSGRMRREFLDDPEANGFDCRGAYDLVSLDHFPLRSLESFLVKMHRGDVVVANKMASNRYWRTRNHHDFTTSDLSHLRAAAKAEYERLLQDTQLAALHDAACAAHEARISALEGEPEFEDRKRWIFNEAWHSEVPEAYRDAVVATEDETQEA
ncbi:glycosyltransferase family 2 protein [Celeribacter naphthalenivorans]|uniref:glycosyltransferase family 2 protein n=1 Tax=Celeribacter naphthalenivorans TaxID=1614694 RepID=UPI001CFC272E|nr:glycosyltransferase family 2 protein [Celeribacter naphthalenivorans]